METIKQLTRGRVARAAGVNLETIRYYERQGLVPRPPRNRANYRLYPKETVARVRFVKRAQELGFSLREIKELMSLRATPGTRCSAVRRRAEAKIQGIDEKVRTLRTMRQALGELLTQCSGRAPVSECPILGCLDCERKI